MEHIVTGCKDCCFCDTDALGYYKCNHPEVELCAIISKVYTTNEFLTPENCPLKKEPITIKIEE